MPRTAATHNAPHDAPRDATDPRIRVQHLITGLGTGGAETALHRLLSRLDPDRFACRVVSLLPGGELAQRIRELGVEVTDLGMRRSVPNPSAIMGLRALLVDFSPHVLQTWLYHADLLGLLASWGTPTGCVAWNLRCSVMELSSYSPMTRLVRRALAWLSARPAAVVANSQAAVDHHRALGYRAQRFEVIPNGVDPDVFRPDAQARAELRAEWGAGDAQPVVGLVGRWDHMKGHDVFFQAAAEMSRTVPDALFVLCGTNVDRDNADIVRMAQAAGVLDRCRLLGRREDVPRVMAALDAACLSSHGESFPNVVAEAMSCGVSCAVTDAGDAAVMVADTGMVAPVRDARALGGALARLAHMDPAERADMGRRARQRVVEHFSLSAMADGYATFYEHLARQHAGWNPEGGRG